MNSIALIKELQPFAGRILDADSHEMIPAQEWVNIFGKEAAPLAETLIEGAESETVNLNTSSIPDYPGDTAAITADIIDFKGARAPGAKDVPRRLDVMNAMGIKRQLMYPTGLPLLGVALLKEADNNLFMHHITGDRAALARRWFDLYNDWAIAQSRISSRIRPVATLYGDTPAEIIERASMLVKNGIRAVIYLPISNLPGGRSPAHEDLDRLWSVLAEAKCVLTMHIEAEPPAQKGGWRDAKAFEGFLQHGEIATDPAYLVTLHQRYENFLSYMIMGGVFERHPTLRVGVAEVGAHWVGPLCERLDLWWKVGEKFGRDSNPHAAKTFRLKERPSEYLRRNIRVAPFAFEDAATMIERYDLGKVMCFSTDYPHVEGGRNAFSIFYNNVQRLGPSAVEDFFINNAEFILAD